MEARKEAQTAAKKRKKHYKNIIVVGGEDFKLSEEGGRAIARMIIDFFKQPGVEEDFQRWCKTPEGMAAAE